MRYFEDLIVGETEEFGQYTVTRKEVLEFAGKYDPQPFHLDDEAAAKTFFGKISASGWHTSAMTMRMMVDHWSKTGLASHGASGIDKIRWRRPVYPGDTLRVRTTLNAKEDMPSKPELGVILSTTETMNQHDVVVMVFESRGMIGRRSVTA